MENISIYASNGVSDSDSRSTVYRLKVELRREQREDRDDKPYAKALRRVIRAFLEHEPEDALVLIEDEVLDLEAREDVGVDEVEALRRALVLTAPSRRGSRELFAYYLRKMEAAGRGREPFAQALRTALESEDASLDELFHWKRKQESSD